MKENLSTQGEEKQTQGEENPRRRKADACFVGRKASSKKASSKVADVGEVRTKLSPSMILHLCLVL